MTTLSVQRISPEEAEKFGGRKIDLFADMLLELFLIRNPKYKFDRNYQEAYKSFESGYLAGKPMSEAGQWFLFPWSNTVSHVLPGDEYFELRTARNKNLITKEEQEKFYNSCIGIAGLSVGSHCAFTIAMMGGAKHIKLADPDVISLSNLNRIRYGSLAIGAKKAELAAQIIAEMNPYAQIDIYDEGLNKDNLEEFFQGIQLFVEETDSLELKITGREMAKKMKVPVIMATDNGDGVIVDVERYDLDPNLKLFNGALGDINFEMFTNFPPTEMPKLATKVAGPEYIVPRMALSLMEVGRTLYSWPQLGSAATFSGVAVAYLARKILVGDNIKSGKYDINLDSMLDGSYNDNKTADERNQIKSGFLKALGL